MKKQLFAITILLSSVLFISCASSRNATSTTNEIITSMNKAAEDWNKADLDAYMALYDTASTFMLPNGPIGITGMKANYEKGFFVNGKPKQNLRYEEMVVRPLGKDYALLTGKFVLYGNDLKDRTGRYTLVFVHRNEGWRILHDHSS